MIDSTDHKRMEETGIELTQILDEVYKIVFLPVLDLYFIFNSMHMLSFTQEKLQEVPVMILCNKCDLAAALEPEEVNLFLTSFPY